ncbi:MAG: ribose transport system permease protein [Actinomycetota bacterium]|jgi:ribose transport system permease protein|nr:ribose transport system permease protein [Actinomycetota bacterium]
MNTKTDNPDTAAVAGPTNSRRAVHYLRTFGVVWVTLLLFLGLTVQTDNFLSADNLRNILDQQSTVLIVAAFATLVLIAGGFDVSLSAIYVLSPLVALRVENATGSVALTVLAGVATGLLCGVVNGLVVSIGRINSFIATLATSFIFFGFAYLVSGSSIMRPSDLAIREIAATRWLGVTTATWLSLVTVVIAWVLLERSRFGRYVFAAGGNAEAARLAGVPVERVQAMTFALAGLAAGLAGTLNAARTLTAQAADDFTLVFGVIAAIVVGGTSIAGGAGAVWRSVIGVFFIALLVNGFNLNGVDPIYQRIIQGTVILAAVGIDAWSRARRT